jgi:hypothetical protein
LKLIAPLKDESGLLCGLAKPILDEHAVASDISFALQADSEFAVISISHRHGKGQVVGFIVVQSLLEEPTAPTQKCFVFLFGHLPTTKS